MESFIQDVNDQETGESCLDCETGERKFSTKCHRKCATKHEVTKVIISTNDETGEPEWVYENRLNTKYPSYSFRKFHVPSPSLKSKSQRHSPKNNLSSIMETKNDLSMKGNTNENSNRIRCLFFCNPIFVFLLMACFYPALAVMLCLLLEISIHAWFHRRDEKLPPEKRHIYRFHRSPVHKVLSEFCAICQADRMVYMVGKIHDARLRMKGRAVGTGVSGCGMPGTQVLTTG